METHKEHLKNLCRVCGSKKPKQYKHDKNSDACQGVLSSVLGLDVSSESEFTFPPCVCNSCYCTLKAKQRGGIRSTNLTPHTWLPHDEHCIICTAPPSSGGKPKRRKVTLEVKGRPSRDDNNRSILAGIEDLNVPHYADFSPHTTSFLPNSMLADLQCKICGCIPNQPVEISTCRHYLCKHCIISSCENGNTLHCDCNSTTVSINKLLAPPPLVVELYNNLLITCNDHCGQVMELKHFKKHLASKCTDFEMPSPSAITVDNLLQASNSSHMVTHTMGLLVDKLMPNNGSFSCRSISGKVRQK